MNAFVFTKVEKTLAANLTLKVYKSLELSGCYALAPVPKEKTTMIENVSALLMALKEARLGPSLC